MKKKNNNNDKPLSPLEIERAHQIKKFLLENIRTNYTDQELADKFNTKPFFIKTQFPKVFNGKSTTDILREERLKIAAQRLQNGEPVKAVFKDAGYTSPSSFSNAFKRKYNQSPTLYIKKNPIPTSKKSN